MCSPAGLASLSQRVQLFHCDQGNSGSDSELPSRHDKPLEMSPLPTDVRILLVVQVYVVADPRILQSQLSESSLVISELGESLIVVVNGVVGDLEGLTEIGRAHV